MGIWEGRRCRHLESSQFEKGKFSVRKVKPWVLRKTGKRISKKKGIWKTKKREKREKGKKEKGGKESQKGKKESKSAFRSFEKVKTWDFFKKNMEVLDITTNWVSKKPKKVFSKKLEHCESKNRKWVLKNWNRVSKTEIEIEKSSLGLRICFYTKAHHSRVIRLYTERREGEREESDYLIFEIYRTKRRKSQS